MAKALSNPKSHPNSRESWHPKKQSAQFLEELASLAYKNAKNTFTVPASANSN